MNSRRFQPIIPGSDQLSRGELVRLAEHAERLDQFSVGGYGGFLDTPAGRVVMPSRQASPDTAGHSGALTRMQTFTLNPGQIAILPFGETFYDTDGYVSGDEFLLTRTGAYALEAELYWYGTIGTEFVVTTVFTTTTVVSGTHGWDFGYRPALSIDMVVSQRWRHRFRLLTSDIPKRIRIVAQNRGSSAWQVNQPAPIFSRYGVIRYGDHFGTGTSPGTGATTSVTVSAVPACHARLTLTTAVAVTTSDVTAATTVYLTPHEGETVGLWDGSAWQETEFSEISIKLTDTQTGTLGTGQTVVTGLTDTSQLIAGMEVSGNGIVSGTKIQSILSATSLQLDEAATLSSAESLAFIVPASTNADLFAYRTTSGSTTTAKLAMVLWSSNTARATAITLTDGVYTKSGDKAQRYVGTVRTTSTAGQTEDSVSRRFLWNMHHRRKRRLRVTDTTNEWIYGTDAWRPANDSTANRVEFVLGLDEDAVTASAHAMFFASAGSNCSPGIGVDSTTTDASQIRSGAQAQSAAIMKGDAYYEGNPGVGYHYLQWLERPDGSELVTWYGDANEPDAFQYGLRAEIMA